MKNYTLPKVKICCINSIMEAEIAIKHGASAIGLVSQMPSGPGIINESVIQEIVTAIPPTISTFLLSCETSSFRIIEQLKRIKPTTIQLVDKLKEGSYQDIRIHCPNINIVQVVHVLNQTSILEAKKIERFVDCILLDSGNPELNVKVLGGTGKTHNWSISKQIKEEVNIPVYLAGGLNSTNVALALQIVEPYGIDLCSSVRTNDRLDHSKLKTFFKSLNDYIIHNQV